MDSKLEEVCYDINGDTIWKYNIQDRIYYRFNKQGKIVSKISQNNLPDPFFLWEARLKKHGVTTASELGIKLKPQQATFLLWEHKNKDMENADAHN